MLLMLIILTDQKLLLHKMEKETLRLLMDEKSLEEQFSSSNADIQCVIRM